MLAESSRSAELFSSYQRPDVVQVLLHVGFHILGRTGSLKDDPPLVSDIRDSLQDDSKVQVPLTEIAPVPEVEAINAVFP